MLPYREGGGLPVVGNHTGTPDISNRSWQVCHTWRFTFFKTIIALKLKSLWVWLKFYLIHNKFLGRYAKNWIFHQNNIFIAVFLFKVSAWLFKHAVCKIGLIVALNTIFLQCVYVAVTSEILFTVFYSTFFSQFFPFFKNPISSYS